MLIWDMLVLVVAGAAGGFIGGLVGVGGGLIFAPVLFFYFQGVGIPPDVVAPLTIGTSLLCTLVVAMFSARAQLRKRAVEHAMALFVGLASAAAALAMTAFVTTRPWFDGEVFQAIFGALLLFVASQMAFGTGRRRPVQVEGEARGEEIDSGAPRRPPVALLLTGAAAGAVATAAGVGGGIVLVPAYRKIFRLPIHRAVGTSSATIVLIAFSAVVSYIVNGWGMSVSSFSIGYVDVGRALLLSVPAAILAPVGVRLSHRLDQKRLGRSFAAVALLVAARMLLRVAGIL